MPFRRSNLVQFPRIETEVPSKEDQFEPELQLLASPREWVTPLQASIMFEPLNWRHKLPTERVNERKRTGWWGSHHAVIERQTVTTEQWVPAELGQEKFRLLLRRHWYEWDSQCLPGSAREAVLQQFDAESNSFQDKAALLIKDRKPEEQFLVVHTENGWAEPQEDQQDLAGSYLYYMTYLGLADVNQRGN